MKRKTLILLTLTFLFLFFNILSLEAVIQCGAGSDQYYNPSGCFSVNAEGNPICSSFSMCTSETNTLCKTPEGCICGPCNIIDGYTTPVNPKRNNESCDNYPLCEEDNPLEELEEEQDDETIDYCASDSDSVYNSNGCYEVSANDDPICSSYHMCTSISQVACKRPNGCNCFVDGPDVCENDDADLDADDDADDIGDDKSYEPEPAASVTFLNCDSNDAFGEEFCDKMDGEIPLLGVQGENYLAFLTTNNLEMMLALESPACLLYIGHSLEHIRNLVGSEIPITKPEVEKDGGELTWSNYADGVEAAFICNLPPEEGSATALIGIGNINNINYTATLVFSITAELYPVTVEYEVAVSANGDDAGMGDYDMDNGEGVPHFFKLEGESTSSVTITADFSLDDEAKLLTEEEALELFSNDMEEGAMDIMSAADFDEIPEESGEENNENEEDQGGGNEKSIISCSLITTGNQSLGLSDVLSLLAVPILVLSLLIVFRFRKNNQRA